MKLVLLRKSGMCATVIMIVILFFVTEAFGQPTLASDREDYFPGDTLRLSGSGWQPGETVTFQFLELPEVCTTPHVRTTVADADGNIFYDEFYFNENHRGVLFIVTATGESSGLNAETSFTDATITWDGGGDGVNWDSPNNWSTNTVPLSTDDVVYT